MPAPLLPQCKPVAYYHNMTAFLLLLSVENFTQITPHSTIRKYWLMASSLQMTCKPHLRYSLTDVFLNIYGV